MTFKNGGEVIIKSTELSFNGTLLESELNNVDLGCSFTGCSKIVLAFFNILGITSLNSGFNPRASLCFFICSLEKETTLKVHTEKNASECPCNRPKIIDLINISTGLSVNCFFKFIICEYVFG